jgi:8-amino-7-oxononanoate synthase
MGGEFNEQLGELDRRGLRRRLRESGVEPGGRFVVGGRAVVGFASNDYLGLSGEPFLKEVFARGVKRWGVGAGAARLISGTRSVHLALEEEVADWKGCEAALTFASGYSTAVGVIPALVGRGDVVILDGLSHASLVDGARLSGAEVRVFLHNRLDSLEEKLRSVRAKRVGARVLVVTESVFSMDGDEAPLHGVVELAERWGAMVMVDEAHAAGCVGLEGRGVVGREGLEGRVDVQMGTFSKALGCQGGYVAGSQSMVDWLVNRARSFVYSTAMTPALAEAVGAAVCWVRGESGAARRAKLAAVGAAFRERFQRELGGRLTGEAGRLFEASRSAIVPLVVGGATEAVALSERLLAAGYWVPAVRYPTVPEGLARLRFSLNALLGDAEVEGVVAACGQC